MHEVDGGETTGARLLVTLAINLLIPVAQILGGLYAHSMSLIVIVLAAVGILGNGLSAWPWRPFSSAR